MKETIKDVLNEKDLKFYTNENGHIVVDCSGNDYNFLKTINLINEMIEEWTYDAMSILKIEIACGFKTVTFKI